jgi:hypothetical protein
MLHAAMVTSSATAGLIHLPVEFRASALLAEVAGERLDVEEADKRKEFSNAVLQRSTGQTPLMISF